MKTYTVNPSQPELPNVIREQKWGERIEDFFWYVNKKIRHFDSTICENISDKFRVKLRLG